MIGSNALRPLLLEARRRPAPIAGPCRSMRARAIWPRPTPCRIASSRGPGRPVGYKIAYINPALQRSLGIPSPMFGRLLEDRVFASPAALPGLALHRARDRDRVRGPHGARAAAARRALLARGGRRRGRGRDSRPSSWSTRASRTGASSRRSRRSPTTCSARTGSRGPALRGLSRARPGRGSRWSSFRERPRGDPRPRGERAGLAAPGAALARERARAAGARARGRRPRNDRLLHGRASSCARATRPRPTSGRSASPRRVPRPEIESRP